MKITKAIFRNLEGLYVNQLVASKYDLDEDERKNIRDKFKELADSLDELKVPWKIQNQVAYAGTKQKNWERYNQSVINEIINKYNN